MKNYILFLCLFATNTLFSYQEILQSAKITKMAFDNFSFAWTAVHGNPDRNHFEVDVLHQKKLTRLKMYAVSEARRKLVSTTHITPDIWYVEEDGKKVKYRPFEAHYTLPKAYYYLMTSKVQFANYKNVEFLGNYSGVEEEQHHFYRPVSEVEKEAIRKQVDTIRNKIIPKAQTRNEENFFLIEAKKLLEYAQKGKLNVIEKSGIISRLDTPGGIIEIRDFRWLTVSSKDTFTPSDDYKDKTYVADIQNSILFSYSGNWNPGWSNLLTDGRYIDLNDGASIRRIPFKGSFCKPFAFDPKQNFAYITGQLPGDLNVRPFIIDLKTGSTSPIGGRNIHKGTIADMVLSPNKKKIALLHNPEPHIADIYSLIIIDLKEKTSRSFKLKNEPTKLCWHPDNQSIFYSHTEKGKNNSKISYLKPGRVISDLVEGHYPVFDVKSKRLLFLDLNDQLWKSCDLKGENISLFKDGLQRLQFPSFHANFDQAVMILEDEDHWPVPVIYNLLDNKVKKITEVKGLWLHPVWN